jgi:hypothetical protein
MIIHPYAKKDLEAYMASLYPGQNNVTHPPDTPADRRKARRKIRRSNRYARIGKSMKARLCVCSTCGSIWDENIPCPCYTEGIQQRMTFEPIPSWPGKFAGLKYDIAQYYEVIFEIGENMSKNFALSVDAMVKLTADLPPIPSPASILSPIPNPSTSPYETPTTLKMYTYHPMNPLLGT